jgi:hypothetical protein
MAKLELKGEIIDARAEVEKCTIESQLNHITPLMMVILDVTQMSDFQI